MVVITLKRTEADQFLYECRVTDSNDKVIRDLCNIWNMKEKIGHLAAACEELAKHGRMKAEEHRGIDEIQEKSGVTIDKGPNYNPDPLGIRDGNAPPASVGEVILRTCEDAKLLASKSTFMAGTPLTVGALQDKINLIQGAVTMAYPMGLPSWDSVYMLLNDPDDAYLRERMGNEYFDPATASLWWAGKEFFRDQTVGDRVGKNDKTKIVARLQKPDAGAPAREPAVSEEERKAMMAFYFKKQEEEKALAEDRDDEYLSAAWANPKALKSELLGTKSINFRPGGGAGRR